MRFTQRSVIMAGVALALAVPAGVTAAAASPAGTGHRAAASTGRPPGREWASFAYDPRLHQLVLFGGDTYNAPHAGVFRGTWTRSGVHWIKRHPRRPPSARTGAALVYDAATGQLLLFGGSSGLPFALNATLYNATWVWTGHAWRKLYPASAPPAEQDANLVYDAASHEVILFGGDTDTDGANETWAWNGATWTQLHPASSPPMLANESMAYDGATRRVILFGGNMSYAGAVNQTWSWDGTTWTQLTPAVHPPDNAAGWQAAYDPASRQLILLGQAYGSSHKARNQIWDWTGTTWRKLRSSSAPADRSGATMTYDNAIRKIVLFGGHAGWTYPASIWTWNGRYWRSP